MPMTAAEAVHWQVGSDQVATIRLDRPEVRNALDELAWHELLDAVRAVGREDVRAVVLTGGDSFFSAGGDVRSMPGPESHLMAPAQRLAAGHEVIRGLVAMNAPVIAAVERYALGAAWGLVLACDLVVAGRAAFFQSPFALRGLVADAGIAWQLPKALGHQRAMRYLLLAERLPAPEALELGLVSHLVPDGEATSSALEIAARLALGPGESNALTKSLAHRGQGTELTGFLREELVAVALAGHGRDAAEGRAAFVEKRNPDFT